MKSELNASEVSRVPPTKRKRGPQQGGVGSSTGRRTAAKKQREATRTVRRCAGVVCEGREFFFTIRSPTARGFTCVTCFAFEKSSKGGIRKRQCSNTRNAVGNVPVEAVGAALYYGSLCRVRFDVWLETENVFGRQTKEERNFSPLGEIVAAHHHHSASKIHETCEGDRW
jgi:hypothetical protein